jgi:hypothetical protein
MDFVPSLAAHSAFCPVVGARGQVRALRRALSGLSVG